MTGRNTFVRTAGILLWGIVGVCCLAPILWLAVQLCSPAVWRQMNWDRFRWVLLGHTVLYAAVSATLATAMALPAAVVVGRGRGVLAKVLMFLLPLGLVLPSVTYTYGWVQAFRMVHLVPAFGSTPDILRCIWTLSAWLWCLPALVIGLSLRTLDSGVQQAAMLDGALWRVTWRMLAGPIIAAFCIASALAMQEFAIYERSGIPVISTEVRTVFETGMGSEGNPAVNAGIAAGSGRNLDAQAHRAGAAVAVAMPMIVLAGVFAVIAVLILRRVSWGETIDAGLFPLCLQARAPSKLATAGLLLLTLGVPVAAMVLSISPYRWQPDAAGHWPPMRIWLAQGQDLEGTLFYGALSGLAALVLAGLASARARFAAVAIGLGAFLIGGEILSIADIRIFNRDVKMIRWIYDGPAIMVIAAVGRFGWIALAAGFATTGGAWRRLRDTAAVDGASPGQTLLRVVWPLAWPVLLASAVLVMILSMTEVATAVLICPLEPTTLVVRLMGWVHMLRYDEMLEGTLMFAGVVALLGAAVVALFWVGGRMRRMLRFAGIGAAVLLCVTLLPGCRDRSKPEAIWLETGMSPGQLVYPRGIVYSRRDHCFFVVDRSARIQRVESDGKVSLWWRTPEWANGKPVGLSIGPDGNVYVPDTHYARVLVYSPKGELLRQWGSFGKEPGQFIYPTDIAFDSDGNIYVAEYGENDRIQVFDPKDLKVIRIIGGPGQGDGKLSRPQSILIDGEMLYVTDSCNQRIAVFTIQGKWVRSIGSVGTEVGEFRYPYGLDMDSQGRLVVCEFGNNRIQWVDKQTGKGLKTWGSGGREPGQLAYSWGVAIDENDRVVVVDSGNNRLQVTRY